MQFKTILVEKKTRDKLRKIGFKGQTYDQVISELLKAKDSLDPNLLKSVSSESLGAK